MPTLYLPYGMTAALLTFVPPIDGHEIFAGAINKHDNSVAFNLIIDDPVIDVTTGVINGIDKQNDNTLYIDVFGSV